jgi:hypothetical protein
MSNPKYWSVALEHLLPARRVVAMTRIKNDATRNQPIAFIVTNRNWTSGPDHDRGIFNPAKQASYTAIGAGEPAFNLAIR